MPWWKTILYPTDFSPSARYAFEVARSLARDAGAELVAVHVAPIPDLDTKRGYREEVEAALTRLTTSDPTVRMRWLVLAGDPVAEILWLDREGWCDLIVMGTRGHTGLRRLWHGSVTRAVQRRASCPVIAVQLPPPGAARRPEIAREEVGTRTTARKGRRPTAGVGAGATWGLNGGSHAGGSHHLAPDELLALRR